MTEVGVVRSFLHVFIYIGESGWVVPSGIEGSVWINDQYIVIELYFECRFYPQPLKGRLVSKEFFDFRESGWVVPSGIEGSGRVNDQ